MSTMDTVVRFLQQLRTGQGVSERAAQILFTFKRDLQKEQDLQKKGDLQKDDLQKEDLQKEKDTKISSETKRAVEVPVLIFAAAGAEAPSGESSGSATTRAAGRPKVVPDYAEPTRKLV